MTGYGDFGKCDLVRIAQKKNLAGDYQLKTYNFLVADLLRNPIQFDMPENSYFALTSIGVVAPRLPNNSLEGKTIEDMAFLLLDKLGVEIFVDSGGDVVQILQKLPLGWVLDPTTIPGICAGSVLNLLDIFNEPIVLSSKETNFMKLEWLEEIDSIFSAYPELADMSSDLQNAAINYLNNFYITFNGYITKDYVVEPKVLDTFDFIKKNKSERVIFTRDISTNGIIHKVAYADDIKSAVVKYFGTTAQTLESLLDDASYCIGGTVFRYVELQNGWKAIPAQKFVEEYSMNLQDFRIRTSGYEGLEESTGYLVYETTPKAMLYNKVTTPRYDRPVLVTDIGVKLADLPNIKLPTDNRTLHRFWNKAGGKWNLTFFQEYLLTAINSRPIIGRISFVESGQHYSFVTSMVGKLFGSDIMLMVNEPMKFLVNNSSSNLWDSECATAPSDTTTYQRGGLYKVTEAFKDMFGGKHWEGNFLMNSTLCPEQGSWNRSERTKGRFVFAISPMTQINIEIFIPIYSPVIPARNGYFSLVSFSSYASGDQYYSVSRYETDNVNRILDELIASDLKGVAYMKGFKING